MGKMAVEHPVARAVRYELDIPGLRYADERGASPRPDRLRLARSLAPRFPKREPMQMNRMVVHAEIDDTDAHALALLNDQRRACRTSFAVQRKPVELHIHAVGDGAVRKHRILLQRK